MRLYVTRRGWRPLIRAVDGGGQYKYRSGATISGDSSGFADVGVTGTMPEGSEYTMSQSMPIDCGADRGPENEPGVRGDKQVSAGRKQAASRCTSVRLVVGVVSCEVVSVGSGSSVILVDDPPEDVMATNLASV